MKTKSCITCGKIFKGQSLFDQIVVINDREWCKKCVEYEVIDGRKVIADFSIGEVTETDGFRLRFRDND